MNAASLRKFGDLAARTGEGLWPGTVTIAGVEHPAEVKPPKLTGEIEEGGELEEGDLLVQIRKAILPDAPARDVPLTYAGKAWRITSVTGEEAASAVWVLECERDS